MAKSLATAHLGFIHSSVVIRCFRIRKNASDVPRCICISVLLTAASLMGQHGGSGSVHGNGSLSV